MKSHRLGYRLVTVVTILSSLGLSYFAILGLTDPGKLVDGGGATPAKVFAGYMAVRGLVLTAALIGLLVLRAWRPLAGLLAFDAAVQVGDTVLGIGRGQGAEAIGPAVFVVLLLAAAAWLWRHAPRRNPDPA